MLSHDCKNLSDVVPVNLNVRLSIHSPTKNENVIEITRHSQSMPLGVLTAV
uniref:Uncharacterized protein n=1 Tax=Peronospora matthiolae TaxID=2874970 RepID=A0AAV1TVN6_9STRA